MVRVLLLEDEPLLLAELAGFLEEGGHKVTPAGSVAAFRQAWSPGRFDVAIVDRGLPDGDGLDVVAGLRASGEDLGIIIMTGRGEVAERVSGLGRGADHYLVKPVRLEILAATVAALVRRIEGLADPRRWALQSAGWKLVPPGREPVALGRYDFVLLRALVEARGRPVRRRALVAALGEDPEGFDERRLDKEISRLRRRVLEQSGVELPVQAAHGIGYAFTAECVLKP